MIGVFKFKLGSRSWWKELLTAVGFTMWVMAGAVLIAKVIGVPNLGVGTVAYNMSHSAGISEEDSDHHPNAMQHGVIELTDCDFEDNIRRRWLSFPNFGSIGSPVAVIPPKNLVSQSTLEVLVRG